MTRTFLRKGLGLQAVALVALAAVIAASAIFVSATPAEAQTATPDAAASAPPGTTVIASFPSATGTEAAPIRFRITEDSDGTATFANGAQSISCYVESAVCDAIPTPVVDGTATPSATSPGIQLRVTIDDDSPLGPIYVQQVERTGGEYGLVTGGEITINVIRANPPVAIKAYGTPPAAAVSAAKPTATIPADPEADGPGTVIGVQLVNARAEGIDGTSLLVTTTRGVLSSDHVSGTNTCGEVSACTLVTQEAEADDGDAATTDNPDGVVQVRLTGNGITGTAQVTFRDLASGLSRTVEVVLHGNPASISAEVDESTIGVGGMTFIVVTIVDADGNPTVGTFANVEDGKPLTDAIVPPTVPAGSSANAVTFNINADRGAATASKDDDIPACGDHPNEDDTATTDVDESVGSLDASAGTNTDGKCVIQITAPDEDGTADDATRGTHAITIASVTANGVFTVTKDVATVTVEVTVGGAPASISSDAPAQVDSLSTTKITVTVMDDAGERVGAVPVSVVQVEGSGNADGLAPNADDPKMTSDGRASFTYLAPLTPGEAVFLVRAGTGTGEIRDTIQIQIGETEAEVEEVPAAISLQLRAGGFLYAVTAEGPATTARALFGDAVTVAWKYNADTGMWDASYIPSRAGSNFSINTGDILYVNSPIDQTVGG